MARATVEFRALFTAALTPIFALALPSRGQAQDVSGAWMAIEVAGKPARGPSMTLTDGRLAGTGGCNRISGPATISGTEVKIGPLISTRMMCEGKMETEAAYIAALEAAKSFELAAETLTFKDAAGVALAKFTR